MSATPEELQEISVDLVKKHGLDVMALVSLADFVGTMTIAHDSGAYATRLAEMGRCVRARLKDIDKTDEQYVAACQDFYRARNTVFELAALPD